MKIFELFGSISLKGGAETKGEISDIDKRAVQMGQNMRKAGAAMTAAGGLMVGTAAKIVGSYAKAGDEINKMALRTGVSEDALSRWRVAAQRSGTDLVAVETGVKRMQRSIIGLSDGLAENTRSFARLNLNLEDLQDLKPEEQLRLIMARMADIEDPTLRAATAQEILGRSGTALLPALENGAKGLEDLMKVAEETGEVFDKEAAKAAAEYQDSMRDMWGAITGLVRVFAVELMPVLREVIERVKDAAVGAREWIEDNRELVAGLSRFALIAGGILSVLGPIVIVFGQLLISAKPIIGVIKLITTGFVGLNPIVLATAAAITGLVIAYQKMASAVRKANEEVDRSLRLQRTVNDMTRLGVEGWKTYGDESVEALRSQGLAVDEAKEISQGLFAMESEMRQAGETEAADSWRRRAELYRDYHRTYAEDLTQANEAETAQTQDHYSEMEDEYRALMERLGDIDEESVDNREDIEARLKEISDKIASGRTDLVDHLDSENERLSVSERGFVDAHINAMGDLIEGNEKAALSGALSSIFNLLPWPASTIAARLAKPVIYRMLPGLKDGGTVRRSGEFMVGEEGMERVRLPRGSEVIPLGKNGSGGGNHIEISIDSLVRADNISPENIDETMRRAATAAQRELPSAIEFALRNNELVRNYGGRA